MKLLKAKQVKEAKDELADERQQRVATLHRVETETVQRINKLKSEETRLSIRNKAKKDAELSVRKSVLETEVGVLEARKKEALIPVDREWGFIKDEKARNQVQIKEIASKKSVLAQKREALEKKETALLDRENKVKEEESTFNDRKKALIKWEKTKNTTLLRLSDDENVARRKLDNILEEGKVAKIELETTHATRMAEMKVKENTLESQVGVLQEKKRVASMSLQNREDTLEEGKEALQSQIKQVNEKKANNEEEQQRLVEIAENLADKSATMIEREVEIENRHIMVEAEEKESKKSAKKLSSDWKKYYEATHEKNDEFNKKEASLVIREKAVKVTKDNFVTKEKELETREKKLADGRSDLHSASQEIKTKKQNG